MRWSRPQIAKGERIYAIGDIHGCLDLFASLLREIEEDARSRRSVKTRLVVIGDFIDRGSDSADIMKALYLISTKNPNLIVLRGNHEQVMLQALKGDLTSFEAWLRFGGEETLHSWGVRRVNHTDQNLDEYMNRAIATVPIEIVDWLSSLPFSYRSSDVLFVHAGIKPGVPIDKQNPDDLLWIGNSFLSYTAEHPALIVHGHTISESGPEILSNRIGIDTGAYRTGRLSAVGFERGKTWIITSR